LFQATGWAQTNHPPTFGTIYQRKIPAWFNEAKFGVFIVWGVIPFPAGRRKVNTLNGMATIFSMKAAQVKISRARLGQKFHLRPVRAAAHRRRFNAANGRR